MSTDYPTLRAVAGLPPNAAERIGAELRVAAKRYEVSQRVLALHSGVNHGTISRIMNDQRVPTIPTAIRLSRAMVRIVDRHR